MRFVCDSCRAQYMISDDKVGAKGVKVRCKKCGYVILVRRGQAAQPPPPAALGEGSDAQATQMMEMPPHAGAALDYDPDSTSPGAAVGGAGGAPPAGRGNVLGSVPDDEISSVFDQVLNSSSHPVPEAAKADAGNPFGDDDDEHSSTRVLDPDTVRKLAIQAADESKPNGHSAEEPAPAYEWFVAIDDKQVGPFNEEKIKSLWDRGEIGPDSLCWRSGFSDWTALSEVGELARVLAPKPQKPILVTQGAPAGGGGVISVPVESAFSSGGMTRTVRSEVPVLAGPAGQTAESTGWKPSAASALQSLVKEEIAALTKPAAKAVTELPAPQMPPAGGGLLDLPDAPHAANGKPVAEAPVARPAAQAPESYAPAPYATYRPPEDNSKKVMMLGIIVGGVVLVAVAIVVTVFLLKGSTPPASPPPQVAVAPAAPAPSVVQPKVAPAPAPAPAPAQAAPAPTPAPAAVTPAPPPASAITSSRGERHSSGTGSSSRRSEKADEARPSKEAPVDSDDKSFEEAFGAPKKKEAAPAAEAPKKKKSDVYIPDAPGGGGDMPDTLSPADIMQGVLQYRPAIVDCAKKQKAKDPDTSGTLVMKWNVLPNGHTANVTVQNDEFKSTFIAGCMSGLIKGWNFPKHKSPQDPIVFPFKF